MGKNCVMCDVDVGAGRKRRKTCSVRCQKALGVKTRQENGTYAKTKKQRQRNQEAAITTNQEKDKVLGIHTDYRNKKASSLVVENGILVQKQCTSCMELKKTDCFRQTKLSEKAAKSGLATYCKICEKLMKEKRRREEGVKPLVKLQYTTNQDGILLEKECSVCHLVKPSEQYHAQKLGKFGKRALCNSCDAGKTYEKKYGITMIDKEAAYNSQNGLCGICKNNYKIQDLFIDHDHAKPMRSSFRGLLCNNCNWAYGKMGDGRKETQKTILGLLEYYSKTTNTPMEAILGTLP